MSGVFDGVAGRIGATVMAALNADMERAALDLVAPRDAERFLVVGFGPGVGLVALLDRVEPASVLAVDPSKAMVEAAGRRLAGHSRARLVELRQATASQLHCVGQFDAAIAVNNQQLWRPHRDTLAAIARALTPGGRLATVTHRWALTKQQKAETWKDLVEADLAAVGLGCPCWTESTYRSGAGISLLARK